MMEIDAHGIIWPPKLADFDVAEEPHVAEAFGVYTRMVSALDAARKKLNVVVLNSELSAKGKVARYAALADEFEGIITDFVNDVAGIEARADRLIELKAAFKPPKADAVSEIRAVEIRSAFAPLTPTEVNLRLLGAAEDQDAETFGSLRGAPASLQKLTAAQLTRAAELWAAKSNPTAVRGAGRIREAAAALSHGILRMRDELASAAARGAGAGDFVKRIRGLVNA